MFAFKNKFSSSSNDTKILVDRVFNENIKTMKEAAKDYYTTDKLPVTINESKKLTLQDMLDKKMILEFVDKNGNICSNENSYVQVTKITDNEYTLKIMLSCDNKSDYILDTIGCYDNCHSGCKILTTQYEFKKTVDNTKTTFSCPSGYSLNGKYCYKGTVDTISSTEEYSREETIITDAKISNGKEYKVYTDPIITKGTTTYSCSKGTLSGTKCNVTTTTDATSKTSYSCSKGTLSGTKCNVTTTTDATAKTTYSCSKGTLSGAKCNITTTVDATPKTSYGDWYVVKSYKVTNPKQAYVNSTEKLVYEGTTREYSCGTPSYCPTKVTYYLYTLYKRSSKTTYSCSKGTLSGTKCNITTTTDATSKTSYSCSKGTLSGTKCNITTSVDATAKTTYSCSKGTLSGTKCNIVTTTDATPKTTPDTYSCPKGYNTEGSGAKTKCYIIRKTDSKYYCSNINQTLNGNKCYEVIPSKLIRHNCKEGYTLTSDNKCISKNTEKIAATSSSKNYSSETYKWYKEKILDGWIATGKYRILDENGKVVNTGNISDLSNSNKTQTENENSEEVIDKKMEVNKNTETTTTEYLMYIVIIIGIIVMAFASITMAKVRKLNN